MESQLRLKEEEGLRLTERENELFVVVVLLEKSAFVCFHNFSNFLSIFKR